MEPEHHFVSARLVGVFLCALPAARELYQYINDPRYGTGISLFSLSRFSDLSGCLTCLTYFTRFCAVQENSENGATRLVNSRYDRHRVTPHR